MRLLLVILLCIAPAAAAQVLPQSILAAIAEAPKPPRAFTETVSSKWLKTPQVQTGFVKLESGGVLSKITREPEAMIVRISADALSLTRADGQQRTVPASRADVAALLVGLRGLLLGDAAALGEHYAAQAEGAIDAWTLQLTPLDPALAKRLQHITVSGQGGQIDAVRMLEPDGDTRVLEFAPL